MPIELKVPPVGESITEVQIGDWLKAEGETVSRDEIIVKIETDKVTVDLPAPATGTITQIKAEKGAVAQVGEVIGYMEEGAGAVAAKSSPPPVAAKSSSPPAALPPVDVEQEEPKSKQRESVPPQGFARVMPSARRALKERGVQPDEVEATGPGGRVLKEDVMRYTPKADTKATSSDGKHEEAVPMSPFRKKIAERLVQSQQTAALLTTFNEVDMTSVMALRKEHQESFQEKYGIKLGFMSFFVKAAI
ncbi:MAG TPA: biotin/lipoyl-containing protein, partial [Polyangiaceae bacterium]|nr:biotin/lipoyl-containing protein [Polyangiaceae bacterium]